MTICSLSLLALFVSGIVMYLFREPSEEEIKKFNSKTQDRSDWSNMGCRRFSRNQEVHEI